VSTGFYQVLIAQSKSVDATRSVSRIGDEARLGFNRMVRDAREADLISAAASDGSSFTIKVNYNGDGLYQNPNAQGDNEILTYAYSSAAGTVTLNGETLMSGVTCVKNPDNSCKSPLFTFSSNLLDYDWDGNGTTTWLEVDQASCASHGVTGVGNCNSTLDAPEFPYLSTVAFAIRATDGSRFTDFYATTQLRNKV
jgi:hypothetical protein